MAKLKLITPEPKQEATSDVYEAVRMWLSTRPDNTRRSYLGIGSDWSRWLGAEFDSAKAGALWKKARHTDAQRYVSECTDRPAQQGRAADASPDGRVSLATVKQKVAVLKITYDALIAAGLVVNNPFARIAMEMKRAKVDQRRPHEEMSKEELKRFLTFDRLLPDHYRDRSIFHLLFGAALRRSEVVPLMLSDVMETSQGTTYLRLRKTKSGTAQKIALADWVAKEVNEFKARRVREGAQDRDLLFVRYLERRHEPMGEKFVYRLFKSYCKILGVKSSYSPHCARVTAITQLLKQGLSHHEVQQLSRHSSITMVERYDRRRYEIDQSPSKKLSYDD